MVSCLSDRAGDDPASQPYAELQRRQIPPESFINLDVLSDAEARLLLFDRWLPKAGRKVSDDQRARIEQRLASPACRQPIFLKLLFDEVQLWHSYDPVPVPGESVPALLGQLFDRLSLETNHGPLLVNRVLGYLSASRHGLAENEILEILFADPEYRAKLNEATEQTRHELPPNAKRIPIALWSRLRFDLAPYLTERAAPGANVLTFYHRQVAEWVQEHFAAAPDQITLPHRRLAAYFNAQDYFLGSLEEQQARAKRFPPTPRPANVRKVDELPWQRLETAKLSGEWGEVEKLFTDWFFLETKTEAGMVFDLAADFSRAVASLPMERPIRHILYLLEEAIRLDIQFIERHPTTLFQSLFNLCSWNTLAADKHSPSEEDTRRDGEEVSRTGSLRTLMRHWREQVAQSGMRSGACWLRAVTPPRIALGTSAEMVFRPGGVVVSISSDGELMAYDSDHEIRVVYMRSGAEICRLALEGLVVLCLEFSPSGDFLAVGGRGRFSVWNLATLQRFVDLRQSNDPWFSHVYFDHRSQNVYVVRDRSVLAIGLHGNETMYRAPTTLYTIQENYIINSVTCNGDKLAVLATKWKEDSLGPEVMATIVDLHSYEAEEHSVTVGVKDVLLVPYHDAFRIVFCETDQKGQVSVNCLSSVRGEMQELLVVGLPTDIHYHLLGVDRRLEHIAFHSGIVLEPDALLIADTCTGTQIVLKGHRDRIRTIAFCAHYNCVASISRDALIVHRMVQPTAMPEDRSHQAWVGEIEFGDAIDSVLTSDGFTERKVQRFGVRQWCTLTGQLLAESHGEHYHTGPITAVVRSKQGLVLSGGIPADKGRSSTADIIVWDAITLKEKFRVPTPLSQISSISLSPPQITEKTPRGWPKREGARYEIYRDEECLIAWKTGAKLAFWSDWKQQPDNVTTYDFTRESLKHVRFSTTGILCCTDCGVAFIPTDGSPLRELTDCETSDAMMLNDDQLLTVERTRSSWHLKLQELRAAGAWSVPLPSKMSIVATHSLRDGLLVVLRDKDRLMVYCLAYDEDEFQLLSTEEELRQYWKIICDLCGHDCVYYSGAVWRQSVLLVHLTTPEVHTKLKVSRDGMSLCCCLHHDRRMEIYRVERWPLEIFPRRNSGTDIAEKEAHESPDIQQGDSCPRKGVGPE